MGGALFIPLGAIVVGLIIKWFDWLYELGNRETNRYKAAILHSFCFGAIFNMIVLAREGLDSFVSRVVFYRGLRRMSDDRKTVVLAFLKAPDSFINEQNHRSGRRLKDNNE